MQKLDRQFIKKVRRKDRIATRIITVGGLLVIASVIAILLLIVRVTLPLFTPAQATMLGSLPPAARTQEPLAVGVDDYQEVAYALDGRGVFTFYSLKTGARLREIPAAEKNGLAVKAVELHKNNVYTLLWTDNSVTATAVDFHLVFAEDGARTVTPVLTPIASLPASVSPSEPVSAAVRGARAEKLTMVALLADGSFQISTETTRTDIFENVTREASAFHLAEELPGRVTAFVVDEKGETLYAGTESGSLLRWDLSGPEGFRRTDNVIATPNNLPVTALAMVFGDISVAVGDAGGNLATWSTVLTGGTGANPKKLRRMHQLAAHKAPVTAIVPSRRAKSLVSLAADGMIHYDHMTSENHLLDLESGFSRFGISGRDNSLIGLDANGQLVAWNIDNPHPEVNVKTLFGKVWYESYDQPAHVWQSSAGNDDFEPKFSIVPLLFGTIKGTLYAMVFAVPLAIFGAVYTSQFTNHTFRKAIKPVVEIMASVPSVVIGFLIALWLAPIIEQAILVLILSCLLLPLLFFALMNSLRPFYKTPFLQNRFSGYEFFLLIPVILLAAALAGAIAPGLENLFFAGSFKQWLFDDVGVRYDQRNSIIIAFGLGIAVIPIIFSITEDAISNIPGSLTAASLALGASRWQTIWRVVLPSASPGIFAAIMIGFGRCIGETMIVLMATGNTPIMDWSIFNGMRTLSANIAVEIPEAPFGGTLYRILFLCATLLFALTFILNTGAEVIRERLRKKYGRY
ncbi:ABC transporter permease subunit [Thiovibrio sp. JS02]